MGDTVPVRFALTGRSTMRIGGIYQPNALAGKYLVGDGFFLAHYQDPLPGAVLLKTDGSAGVQPAVEHALTAYPNVQVQSRSQFEASQKSARSTSCSVWSTRCSPWPCSSPSSGS